MGMLLEAETKLSIKRRRTVNVFAAKHYQIEAGHTELYFDRASAIVFALCRIKPP
jgi:hypothetical protein